MITRDRIERTGNIIVHHPDRTTTTGSQK